MDQALENPAVAELDVPQTVTGQPAGQAEPPVMTDEQTFALIMSALTARLKPEVKIALIMFLPGEGEDQPPYARLGATVEQGALRDYFAQMVGQWDAATAKAAAEAQEGAPEAPAAP